MFRCRNPVTTVLSSKIRPLHAGVMSTLDPGGGIAFAVRSHLRSLATVAAAAASAPATEPTRSSRKVCRLDFAKFLAGNEEEQRQFCGSLVDALRNEGFVKLRNHGIGKQDIAQVFRWGQRFFDLPLDVKNKAAHPPEPNPHRGYSYVGQEILSNVKDFEKGNRNAVAVHDIKESFDQGPADDTMYANRWPDESDLPGFRPFMETFYDQCHRVHLDILRALAVGLHLEPDFLQRLCGVNTSELRLNHYPACSAAEIRAGAMRISEHTDFGTVTLLFQDGIGGLEIEDQRDHGNYFPVAPQDTTEVIVNIGDCLQRWTNDGLRSTSHRVRMPPAAGEWIDDRYSVAYFAKPNRDQSIGPLKQFVREGEAPRYDAITAWEYNQQKLTRTYTTN